MGAAYEVEFRWKEQVFYWEGERGFWFPGGWGVSPIVTYVPSAANWNASVPGWLRDRRDEVLARLRAEPGHVVAVDPHRQLEPAEHEAFRIAG